MVAGENDAGEYTNKGKGKYIGYAPIKSTGWSVAIAVETNEILSELGALKIGIAVSTLVFILLGAIIVVIVSRTITKPISIFRRDSSYYRGNENLR
jgi:methyl-accepting chemotaxis protein